jgi:hypothetical protein
MMHVIKFRNDRGYLELHVQKLIPLTDFLISIIPYGCTKEQTLNFDIPIQSIKDSHARLMYPHYDKYLEYMK